MVNLVNLWLICGFGARGGVKRVSEGWWLGLPQARRARGRRPGVGTHPATSRPGVGPGSGLIWAPRGPGTTFTMSPRGFPTLPPTGTSVMIALVAQALLLSGYVFCSELLFSHCVLLLHDHTVTTDSSFDRSFDIGTCRHMVGHKTHWLTILTMSMICKIEVCAL